MENTNKVITVKSAWGKTLYKVDGQFMTMNQALIYKLNKANQEEDLTSHEAEFGQ